MPDIIIGDHDNVDDVTSPELITKQIRLALRLKRQGHDYHQIARALTKISPYPVSVSIARARIREYWKNVQQETCDEHLKWELERLDDLLRRYYKVLQQWADDPDTVAKMGAQILKVMDRRARYLGLDAPQRVDATVVETTQADLELQEMVNEQRARNAAKAEELRNRSRQQQS